MKIISYSGGKDSTALLLWAIENGMEFTAVYCDTGWESPVTYEYISMINERLLGGKLVTVKNRKYDGFYDLSIKKKRVASTMARFCTEELKLKPMREFIQEQGKFVFLYLGIRAEESPARARLVRNVYDNDFYKCTIKRPLLKWSIQEVIDIHKRHEIPFNPMYTKGYRRVGCFPCVMARHDEIRNIIRQHPERVEVIRQLERDLGRSFFPPDYIPEKYCTGRDPKSGKKFPWVDDVVKYLHDPNQSGLFEEPEVDSCFSYYKICE